MINNKSILVFFLVMLTSGCASQKQWSATGGSRSDAVIRLSYETGELESSFADDTQGQSLASSRCRTWGYCGAEAFGGETRQCHEFGGYYGCARWMITKDYQCTGMGFASSSAPELFPAASLSLPQIEEQRSPYGNLILPKPKVFGKWTYPAEQLAGDFGCSDFTILSLQSTEEMYRTQCGEHTRLILCDVVSCRYTR